MGAGDSRCRPGGALTPAAGRQLAGRRTGDPADLHVSAGGLRNAVAPKVDLLGRGRGHGPEVSVFTKVFLSQSRRDLVDVVCMLLRGWIPRRLWR